MTSQDQTTDTDQGSNAGPRRMRAPIAFGFVAYAFGVTMVGTTLPTPLYPLYQHQFAFSSLLTTVIYAVYALGVLAALLLFGQASDALGRRRVLFAALAASALAELVFVTDAGLTVLFIGRIVSGLSAGLITGTATAMLVELAPNHKHTRATLFATAVNMLGLGFGPLLAGVLAEYAPAPLRLPFLAHLVLLVPAVIGVWLAPETVRSPPGARPRPGRIGVPEQARAVFVPAAIAVFAAFSVFGLLTAIEPGFLSTVLHQPDRLLAGSVVFSMFIGSTLGQLAAAQLPERLALPIGCVVLILALAGIAASLLTASLTLLVLGTIVVGIGQGICFRSGMAAVTAHSPAHRRAETVSSYFVVAYLGISVPVVLVGVVSALTDLRTAGIAFTIAVAVLALFAWVTVLRLQRRRALSS
ncbi:MFS transporter [Sciscionella marina]|uniref:MFS transporter n=1 Tax=Sciscionella marina TaxID=508770 RepID=UPI00036A0CF2|nr:MFS transporter [Sciscionella marina]